MKSDELKASQKAIITSTRYDHEIAGIDVSGMPVETDRETRNILTSTMSMLAIDPSITTQWKLSDGTFQTLNYDQLKVIALASFNYVQACFNREAILLKAVDDGTYRDEWLELDWPSQTIS